MNRNRALHDFTDPRTTLGVLSASSGRDDEATGAGPARPRVLCIDDDSDMRDNVLELLEANDWTGIGAASGEEGIRLAREWRPSVVLCDMTLPGLDGNGVLARLREDPLTADIPVVFLSGHADHAAVSRAMALGAAGYLTKPVTCAVLRATVAKHIAEQTRPA